jgi:hypothetical protein
MLRTPFRGGVDQKLAGALGKVNGEGIELVKVKIVIRHDVE